MEDRQQGSSPDDHINSVSDSVHKAARGIKQISTVVQTNVATVEEGAAAGCWEVLLYIFG